MTREHGAVRGRLGAALLATLSVLLLGGLLLHGPAAHGAGHADATTVVAGEAPGPQSPVPDHGHHGTAAGTSHHDVAVLAGAACAAVVGLLLTLLLAVRSGRASRPMALLRRFRARPPRSGWPGQPPSLNVPSILRC